LDVIPDISGLGDLAQICSTVTKMAKILADAAKCTMALVPSTTGNINNNNY
jgi:hypothetical protein